ncbi:hypothetical protein D1BOALGB6SA_3545 [Olavius sp. associated proteobacterium Delta 1]|nr:hypothetical protein D1BOALGB6SA_3545 [Olavius sp. associated proteobacterium Delta 1]
MIPFQKDGAFFQVIKWNGGTVGKWKIGYDKRMASQFSR